MDVNTAQREVAWPRVDYRAHPGFAKLEEPEPDPRAAELLAAANRQLGTPRDALRKTGFAPVAAGAFRDFRAAIEHLSEQHADSAFDRYLLDLTAEIETYFYRFTYQKAGLWDPTLNDGAARLFHGLEADGYANVRLPDAAVDQLRHLTHDLHHRALEMHAAGRSDRPILHLDRQGPAMALLRSLMQEHGVCAAVSKYKQLPMELGYCTLHLSIPGQRWWRLPRYADCPDWSLPKTTWMHCDKGIDMCKGVIYLSEVNAGNGPLSYVKGSHRWAREPLALIASKVLDRLGPGKAYDLFTIHAFTEPQTRRHFLRLPTLLQSLCHEGDDMLDGSPESEQVLASEVPFLSKDGQCLVFDGGRGLHRGAMTTSGPRLALQLGFRMNAEHQPQYTPHRSSGIFKVDGN